MADSTQKFQAPKGTRDFYPADMAVRRYIESVWREVSINHGFEEIDGPTFEHLELYTKKSGEEIVNQLFSFRRAGGEADYALRPEFTPTLARMYAARAGELPKPTKWFCMPNFFRAERPQRGRLREFQQWNIDILGDDSPRADAEVIACTVGVLKALGLTPELIRIRLSDRRFVQGILQYVGVPESNHLAWFNLLDRSDKITLDEYIRLAAALGQSEPTAQAIKAALAVRPELQATTLSDAESNYFHSIQRLAALYVPQPTAEEIERRAKKVGELWNPAIERMMNVGMIVKQLGCWKWIEVDFSIVRGLAYYTGTVFEVHEASGKERAIAGGGRYDGLVQLFDGPPTPAVGIAMGDVVLRNVLEDRGLLLDEKTIQERLRLRADAFVISAKEEADGEMTKIVSELRAAGLHARQSYKATRNVGKLLGDAGKCHARTAVILGDELKDNKVAMKDMESGEQVLVDRAAVVEHVRRVAGR